MNFNPVTYIDNFLTAGIGGFLGWFFTRKKQAAETDLIQGDVLEKIKDSYRGLLVDINAELYNQKEKIEYLKSKIVECEERRDKFRAEQFIKDYASKEFGLMVLNYNGYIEFCNVQFVNYLGLKITQVIGANYSQFYPDKKDLAEAAEIWNSGQRSIEVNNYTDVWKVKNKLVNMLWLKIFNDNENKKTYCVLKIK